MADNNKGQSERLRVAFLERLTVNSPHHDMQKQPLITEEADRG